MVAHLVVRQKSWSRDQHATYERLVWTRDHEIECERMERFTRDAGFKATAVWTTDFTDYRSGVGNRRSTAGHIDCICIVFSVGYIYFKFVNFAIKIYNTTSQIYQTFMLSRFLP